MKKLYSMLTSVLLCSLLAFDGVAQNKPAPKAGNQSAAKTSVKNPQIKFQDVKLKNGLRVLLVEDHSAPVISVVMNFNVGSRDERKGRTGFAHLFEHLMFMGSENVGKNEYSFLIDNNGGANNATTDQDRTIYYQTLPSNQLDLALFLEADRMRALDINKDALDIQRNAVQEERRMRMDNQPYGKAQEKFGETIYDNFAYKHSVIGSMEDLNAASVEDVKDFFRIYYAPNNSVLALVGDFNTAQALSKIKQRFENIPAQPAPPKVDTTEPEQTAERRLNLDDPLAQVPLLLIAHKGVVGNTPDAYAMQILNSILASGQSSRLYQKLVKDKQIALQAGGFSQAMRGAGAHLVQAIITPGKKSEEVEAAIYEELERLQKEPVADWELEKAKNFARRGAINAMSDSQGIAFTMAEDAIAYNDPNLINTRLQKLAAITKADIQRVAQKYFKSTNRTVLLVSPQQKS
ncbi:MAG: insulinase family protein [Acidobacteria bacterium]|nr:insulinase family protein [Acidobacteriota bacterium]